MKYAVIAPDLKWKGERLAKGVSFEAKTDREIQNADLLVLIGKAEQIKTGPIRRAHVERLDHDGDGNPGGSVAVTSEDAFVEMSDEDLREFITKRDGQAPHFRLGRPKLLAIARKTDEPEPVGQYQHRAMKAEGTD